MDFLDAIHMNGLEFYAYHGAFPEENRLGQRFEVTLSMHTKLKEAGDTDDLNKTVDYGDAYNHIKAIMTGEPVKLIETLAERIAAVLLERYEMVEYVRVKIIKPMPPIPGPMQGVAVEIFRGRK